MRVCRCLGYEGYDGLLHIIRQGTFSNLGLTPQDVRRANEIYGPLIAHIKGMSTRCKIPFRNPIQVERSMSMVQKLYVDIMFVEMIPFLVAVSKPMNLVTVEMLPNKGAKGISNAIYNFIDTYRSNSYEIEKLISDGEPNLAGPLSRIPGIRYDPVGTGVHVSIVESKIRRIKEKVRAILHSLPFNWPKKWLHWTVYFAVKARNRIPVRGSGTSLSPVELLTGIKSDARTDLRVAFGDYVQTREMDTDNSMKERSKGCIALLPLGNLEGSVKFMDLITLEPITRTAWTPAPITQETIEYVNSLCERDNEEPVPRDPSVIYRQGQIMPDDEEIDERIAEQLVIEDYNEDFETELSASSEDDESDDNDSDQDNDDDGHPDIQDICENGTDMPDTSDQPNTDVVTESKTTKTGRVSKPSAILTNPDFQSHIPKTGVRSQVRVTLAGDNTQLEKYFIFNLSAKQGIDRYQEKA